MEKGKDDAASRISGRTFEFDEVLVNTSTYRRAMMTVIFYATGNEEAGRVRRDSGFAGHRNVQNTK